MPDGTDKTKRFVVTVAPSDMQKAEAALKAAGANVDERLDAIGVFVVTGDEKAMKAAKAIPGVKAIEPEGTVRTQDR
jgi:hypothetical protein